MGSLKSKKHFMYDGTWFPSAVFKYNIVSICLKKKNQMGTSKAIHLSLPFTFHKRQEVQHS